jgi:hypothetical protein
MSIYNFEVEEELLPIQERDEKLKLEQDDSLRPDVMVIVMMMISKSTNNDYRM